MKEINLFDFDYTIYDGDSTIDFYIFSLKKDIRLIRFFPIQLLYFILYSTRLVDKRNWKSKFFIFLKGIQNIEEFVEEFWNINQKKIKEWYLDQKSNKDIIISASPSFLLRPISERLKVLDLIATEVDKNTGELLSENCYGEEKVKRFNEIYHDYKVVEAYTDHVSDIPMLELATTKYIVKKDEVKIIELNN